MRLHSVFFVSLGLLGTFMGCDSAPLNFATPSRISQALTIDGVSDLAARAEVYEGDEVLSTLELTTSDEGSSFTGFVETEPGTYRVEIIFSGDVSGDDVFLGRWVSDAVTVSAGNGSSASFGNRVDTLGRPEDEGDPDGDGFGNLDELLWGTDRNSDDSDGDGVLDGEDCDPRRAANSLVTDDPLDCDGDGVRRVDVPFGEAGTDCDDSDASVFPGAEDICSDDVDSDCNPQTCPQDDAVGPELVILSPAENASVGCFQPVTVSATDESSVVAVNMLATNSADGQVRTFALLPGDDDEWTLSGFASLFFIPENAIRFNAEDARGNTTVVDWSFEFDFQVPVAAFTTAETTLAPGPQTLAAEGEADVEVLRLILVQKVDQAQFDRVAVLGEIEGSSGTFDVDLSDYTDGQHALYLEAEDGIGNRLTASDTAFGSFVGGLSSGSLCTPAGVQLPLIRINNGESQSPTMEEILPRALAEGAAILPGGAFVEVIAFGIDANGQVDLAADSFLNRWQFGFYDVNLNQWATVTWLGAAFGGNNPVIDGDAGNVSATEPFILDSSSLPSSAAVAAAMSSGCAPFRGSDDDFLRYFSDEGVDKLTAQTLLAPPVNETAFYQMRMDNFVELLSSDCP